MTAKPSPKNLDPDLASTNFRRIWRATVKGIREVERTEQQRRRQERKLELERRRQQRKLEAERDWQRPFEPRDLVAADLINFAHTALSAGRQNQSQDEFAFAVCHGFLTAVCELMQIDLQDVLRRLARGSEFRSDREWMSAVNARRYAMYLANVEADIRQKDVAIAFGLTQAAVCIALRVVHDRAEADDTLCFLLGEARERIMKGAVSEEATADRFQSVLATAVLAPNTRGDSDDR